MPITTKPKEILELENIYNIKLKYTSPEENIHQKYNQNHFSTDKHGFVNKLNLAGNNIDFIYLGDLIFLEELDLSYNNLKTIENLEGLDHLTNLEKLYLSNNNIEVINGLEELPNLKTLVLDNNKIHKIKNLENLENLSRFSISKNLIQKIENLESLMGLEYLNLRGNTISKIEGLEDLTLLNYLVLMDNHIKVIEGLDSLIYLKTLFLSSNKISKIENLDQLGILKELHLWGNNISKIENLDYLFQLRELNLSNNKISKITGLDNLRKLEKLFLFSNQIHKIENLQNLKKLEILNLSGNQISKIENLEELSSLEELNMSKNRIEKITRLDYLKNLNDLNLSENNINKIENLEKLPQLTYLILSKNLIKSIENCTNLSLSKSIQNLQISNNPFIEEMQFVLNTESNHLDIILNELQKLGQAKKTIKLPVKVMLLGNHGSGKSTFLEYFQINKLNTEKDSTHILNIKPYPQNFKDLPKAIFFDFGGQDYYHGIYKVFFTLDSINLLFWKTLTDHNHSDVDSKNQSTIHFNRNYWLGQLDFAFKQRKKYFQDITQEFIFAIQTHAESDSQNFFNHSSIAQSFYISLKEQTPKFKAALTHLKDFLQEIIAEQSKSVEKTESEINLYRHILKQQNSHWTPIEDLKDIYNTEVSFLKAELEQLAMRGLVLYYKHIPALEDVVWLNPSATVKEIHDNILNDLEIRKAKGQIDKQSFEEKVRDEKIIEMLKENKVIFLDESFDTYIIPGYLPSIKEDSEEYFIFGSFENADLTLKFGSFIPFGFINQLICHFGKNPEKKTYRKDLLIFTTHNQKVKILIRLDFEKLEIKLFIKTSHKEVNIKKIQSDLFFDILQLYWGNEVPEDTTYDDAMAEASKIIYKHNKKDFAYELVERISSFLKEERTLNNFEIAPEDMYISLDSRNFIHYKTLENAEETKGEILAYQKDNIGDLDKTKAKTISTVSFKHLSQNPNFKQMKKIFISYSKKDLSLVNIFQDHLSNFKRDGYISTWYCTELKPGESWDNSIQKHFDESDIACFMASPYFIKTDYIYEYELKKSIERQRKDPDFKIIPIILDFCDWTSDNEDYNLGQFSALPYTAKPICDFQNQNAAWLIVIQSLKFIIKENKNPNYDDFSEGNVFYKNNTLRDLFERLVKGKLDNNSI